MAKKRRKCLNNYSTQVKTNSKETYSDILAKNILISVVNVNVKLMSKSALRFQF